MEISSPNLVPSMFSPITLSSNNVSKYYFKEFSKEMDDLSFLKESIENVKQTRFDWASSPSCEEIIENLFKQEIDGMKMQFSAIFNDKKEPIGIICWIIAIDCPFGVNFGKWFFKFGWIEYIYVKPEYRRLGIGRWLVNYVEKKFEENKIQEYLVYTAFVDQVARSFFQNMEHKSLCYIYEKKISNFNIPTEFKWKFATEENLNFIVECLTEIFRIEGVLEDVNWEEEIRLIKMGFKSKDIILVFSENKEKQELISMIWYANSKISHVGIHGLKWPFLFSWILFIFTKPEYRGKGIAKFLYKLQEALCYEKGSTITYLDVYSNHIASQAFHKHFGYTPLVEFFNKKLEKN